MPVAEEVVVASMDFELRLSEIRARLRQVREEQGIYQALRPWVDRLYQAAGYRTSANTALRQENGQSGLSVEYLLAVALSEGISPAWLLTGEGPKYAHLAALPPGAAELLDEVVERIRRGEIPDVCLSEHARQQRQAG